MITKEEVIKFFHDNRYYEWYGGTWKKPEASDMDCYSPEDLYVFLKTKTLFSSNYDDEDISMYYDVCNLFYEKELDKDGKTYINVYSNGRDPLGRFLSNFTRHPIETEDGRFDSIEGYWYFLSCGDEALRKMSGIQAKNYGRKVGAKDWLEEKEFKRKICSAIKTKILTSNFKNRFINSFQPFDHFYVYSGKIVRPSEGRWIIEFLEEFRKELREKYHV